MAAVSVVHFALQLILVGALFRFIELKFHDSDNALGSLARALNVVY